MKIKYECEYCHEQFDSKNECQKHEMLHLYDIDRFKYYVKSMSGQDICSYCANAYYVYGCERNCDYHYCNEKNNYRYFKMEDINDDF